jgi:hypothetical protein
VLLLARVSPAEIRERLRTAVRFSRVEVATRRLGGSSTAFDRGFYRFVESARRTLPAGTPGIALFVPSGTSAHLYLAAYTLAPVPVRLEPEAVPEGWIAAVYGRVRPQGATVIRELPGGALLRVDRPSR